MADNYAICIVGAMDRLWFQQIILFSEPTSPLVHKTPLIAPAPISETLAFLSSSISEPPPITADQSTSAIDSSENDCKNDQDDGDDHIEDGDDKEIKLKKRPKRMNSLITDKSRSHSSSLLNQIHPKRRRSCPGAAIRLQKTMSCKSLLELELEEVKGFMDLGFKFSRENLSPRMMSVVPGLTRLGLCKNAEENGDEVAKDDDDDDDHDHEQYIEEDEEEKRGVMRPYLSEAWLIKRPDSPLLNLRLPRVSAAADMKKHLRFWARTVASVIQQES